MRQTDRLVLRDLARCQAIDQYGVYLLPCPQSLACTTIIKLNPQRKPRSALISDPAPMLCKNQLLQQLYFLVCKSFRHSFNYTLCVEVSSTAFPSGIQVLTIVNIHIVCTLQNIIHSNENGFIKTFPTTLNFNVKFGGGFLKVLIFFNVTYK